MVSTLLYGLTPADPATIGGSAILMLAVAAAALISLLGTQSNKFWPGLSHIGSNPRHCLTLGKLT